MIGYQQESEIHVITLTFASILTHFYEVGNIKCKFFQEI